VPLHGPPEARIDVRFARGDEAELEGGGSVAPLARSKGGEEAVRFGITMAGAGERRQRLAGGRPGADGPQVVPGGRRAAGGRRRRVGSGSADPEAAVRGRVDDAGDRAARDDGGDIDRELRPAGDEVARAVE